MTEPTEASSVPTADDTAAAIPVTVDPVDPNAEEQIKAAWAAVHEARRGISAAWASVVVNSIVVIAAFATPFVSRLVEKRHEITHKQETKEYLVKAFVDRYLGVVDLTKNVSQPHFFEPESGGGNILAVEMREELILILKRMRTSMQNDVDEGHRAYSAAEGDLDLSQFIYAYYEPGRLLVSDLDTAIFKLESPNATFRFSDIAKIMTPIKTDIVRMALANRLLLDLNIDGKTVKRGPVAFGGCDDPEHKKQCAEPL